MICTVLLLVPWVGVSNLFCAWLCSSSFSDALDICNDALTGSILNEIGLLLTNLVEFCVICAVLQCGSLRHSMSNLVLGSVPLVSQMCWISEIIR